MILNSFQLNGKIALITGAARGLGQAMAMGLAEAGADLIALDALPCDDTLAQARALGRRAESINTDLSGMTVDRANGIIAECVAKLGQLDILINNAGIIRRNPVLEFTEQDWRDVLDINLNAGYFLAQAAGREFKRAGRGGKIISTASMLSFQGGINTISYTAAKSAVAGITRALANELAPLNINVNAIAPGYMVTEVTAALRADPARYQAFLNRIPAGRWGDPADLKGAVVFLASAASNYLHGTVIPVDGGWMTR